MKYALIVLALLAAAAGAFVYLGSPQTMQQIQQQVAVLKVGEAPPVRQLAPDSLFSYTEGRDLNTHWETLRASESWKDVEESNVLDVMARQPRVRAFLDTVLEVAEKIDYDVSEENVMKFVGKECGLGLALNPNGGEPDILLLTRLDVAALAQDMTRNTTLTRADWKVLQAELNKRTGQVEFTVTTAPVGDYELATCVRSDVTLFSTLIEDVLVFSTSEALVRAALTARANGGAATLSKLPAFGDELKPLPGDAPLLGWMNIAHVDANRALLEKNCDAIDAAAAAEGGSGESDGEEPVRSYLVMERVLDAVKGAPALAWATQIPEGDLYSVDWKLSRTSAELFADKADVVPSQVLPPGGIGYMEARDMPGLVQAWDRSAAKRRFMESAIVAKAEEMASDADTVRSLVAGSPPLGPDGLPDPNFGLGAEVEPTLKGSFIPRLGWHLVSSQLGTLIGETSAMTIYWDPSESEMPTMSMAMELGVAGRLGMIAGFAAETYRQRDNVRVSEHGGRQVMLTETGGNTFVMALAGDALLMGSSDAAVRTMIDRADSGESAEAAALAAVKRLGFPAGHRMLMHVDGVRLRQAIRRMPLGSDRSDKTIRGILEKALSFESYGMAFYVDDAFTQVDLRYGVSMDAETHDGIREFVSGMPSGSPASWALLTDKPFYVATNRLELSLYYNMLRSWLPADAREEMEGDLAGMDETLEMSLVEDVLPAFGPELTFAATYQAAPEPPAGAPPGAAPPAIPGFMVMLQVRDYDTVKRLIDRLMDLGNESMRDRNEGRPGSEGGPAPDFFVHTRHNGVDLITVAMSDEERAEIGFAATPAFAIVGEFAILSLHDQDIHRAIDLAAGVGSSFVSADVVRTAAADGIDIAGSGAVIVDWNVALDQLAEYGSELGGFVPNQERVPFPEYPDNGDMDEWNRRMEAYQEKSNEMRERAGKEVKDYLDSLRLVRYIASTSRVDGDVVRARTTVRLID